MTTSYKYKKILKNKVLPEEMIYEGVESLENRIENYDAGNPYSYHIREIPIYTHLFTETEARFHEEKALFAVLLHKYELNDSYRAYRKRSRRTCLTDYMSAQFVTKIVAAFREGGVYIKTASKGLIEVDGFENTDNRRLCQPMYYLWTDKIPRVELEEETTPLQEDKRLVTTGGVG